MTRSCYRHIEIHEAQASKKMEMVCGDLVVVERTIEQTTAIVCDGLGSGIKANIAANMCASRLSNLLKSGYSLRKTCESLARTMHQARTSDIPFSAFTLVRVLNNGSTTILSYEMPQPILIENNRAILPKQRFFTLGDEIVAETHCVIKPGSAVIVTSDGVSQAGLGCGLVNGWTAEGACNHINHLLSESVPIKDIVHKLIWKSRDLCRGVFADDTTAVAFTCRPGTTVHLLSGPPKNREDDARIIREWLLANGVKLVCGSTTAEIVARVMKANVQIIEPAVNSQFEPPSYSIAGIDMVTEGALTLNQVYNIIDEDNSKYEPESCVSGLCAVLKSADCIRIWVGGAQNAGHDNITFSQMGILSRHKIIPLIADKLRKMGKLVAVKEI